MASHSASYGSSSTQLTQTLVNEINNTNNAIAQVTAH